VSPLLPFTDEFGTWRSVTPQGADETLIPFEYIAAEGSALSRNTYGDGNVYFVGLNLMFHAAITKDLLAIRILESLSGLTAKEIPADSSIPMRNYEASEDGWRFDLALDDEKWVLLPMGKHSGTNVYADGEPVELVGIESLTLARLPEGEYSVFISSDETAIYTIGRVATVIGILGVIFYLTVDLRRRLRNRLTGKRGESGGRSHQRRSLETA